MVSSDCRCGAEGLDKIAERAQLDDKDVALSVWPRARYEARPECRQSIEINEFRELLESFEHGRMFLQLGGADTGEKTSDEAARRYDHRPVIAAAPRPD